jgi:hypothetical protein
MEEDQAVLDYYKQAAPVSLGQAPQIDPELLRAAMAAQQAPPPQAAPQQAPQTQTLSSYGQPPVAVPPQVAAQRQAGLGAQIQPQGDEVLFPETAWTRKKDESDKKRLENKVRYTERLAQDALRLPEAAIKANKEFYETLNDQTVPKIDDFDKANPRVDELRKEISPLVQKRNTWISGLATYASQADENTMLPGESERDWAQRISPTLLSQLKLYNTALAGSSDALSSQEVSRLVGGQLPETYFTVGNLLRANADVTKGNIRAFQSKLQQLHDILLNQTNDAFNTLAAQSSPKYATQALGYAQSDFLSADNTLEKRTRMDDTANAKVIRGQQTMAQMFLLKKEQQVEEETELAKKALSQGKSKEAVKQIFKRNTGRDLKLNE